MDEKLTIDDKPVVDDKTKKTKRKTEEHITRLNNIKAATEGRCGYFVKRKQRYCKMIPAKGNKYCGEHLTEDSTHDHQTKMRILCPLNPNHSVFADRLQSHLKKCNNTKKIQVPYYEKGYNAGIKEFHTLDGEDLPLHEVPAKELESLIERVEVCYKAYNETVNERIGTDPVFTEELQNETYGSKPRKHLRQQASMVALLKEESLLRSDHTYIEFGAGRGHLSHWVQKGCPPEVLGTRFILVDRSNNRNKVDCYHRGKDQGPSFERLFIDIEHLNLGKVDSVTESDNQIFGLGKHLCGGATDLTLRCVLNAKMKEERNSFSDEQDSPPSKKLRLADICPVKIAEVETKASNEDVHSTSSPTSKFAGCLIALCCYHRCTWNTYFGTGFFIRNNFSVQDFNRIRKIAGWAVCSFHKKDKDSIDKVTNEENVDSNGELNKDPERIFDATNNTRSDHQDGKSHEPKAPLRWKATGATITTSEQEEIGRKCKRLVDFGRLELIRKLGYTAQLISYIEQDVTLENVALLVKRK